MTTPGDSHLSAVPDPPELEGDLYLRWLVALVDFDASVRPAISLSVGGVIYSGTMISRRDFAERLRDEVARFDAPDHVTALLREPFDTMLEVEEAYAGRTREEFVVDGLERATHVHLEQFTAWQADWPSVAEGTPPWRGRIETVDGWTLAHLPTPHRAE